MKGKIFMKSEQENTSRALQSIKESYRTKIKNLVEKSENEEYLKGVFTFAMHYSPKEQEKACKA